MNVQLRSTAYHRCGTAARAYQPDRQAETPPQMRNNRADIHRMCCRATKSEAQIAGMIRLPVEDHRRKTPPEKIRSCPNQEVPGARSEFPQFRDPGNAYTAGEQYHNGLRPLRHFDANPRSLTSDKDVEHFQSRDIGGGRFRRHLRRARQLHDRCRFGGV